MKVGSTTKATIEIEGEDLNNLRTGLKKLCSELDRVGLKAYNLNEDETEIIHKLNKNLK